MISQPPKFFRYFITVVMLLSLFLATGSIVAASESNESSGVNVKAGISPLEITVGDLATYSLIVTHPEKIKIEDPALKGDFTGFELIDQGKSPAKISDGKIKQEFWYRLRGDRVGIHTLPGPSIKFKSLEPNVVGEFNSGEQTAPDTKATIRSVLYLEGEPRDIRTIKPIIGAGWPWKKYILPILAFVLLACLIGYAANWWVKRNLIRPQVSVTPALPPDQMALRELERLYDKGYHLKDQIRELYFEFSEIFRRYLGQRFLIPALDWTTEEIGKSLNQYPDLSVEDKEEAIRILTNTDLVKFAKFQVDPDSAIRLMKSARSFIQNTSQPKFPEISSETQSATP